MFVTNLSSAASNWFEVLQTTPRSQTAVMNLAPGEASGASLEAHPISDQVLLVLEGEVMAHVAEETARLRRGDLILVPAGVDHRFHNTSDQEARAFTVYAPPAYPAGTRG